MDRKIDFLIIGAQKSGTTSLHNYLKQHPDIFLPEIKEILFFANDEFYRQGEKYLDVFYKDLNGEKVIGGADVNLMYSPIAPDRIHMFNPNMKLIAVLRNPIDRAYSAYWFARRNGWELCKTFEEALGKEHKRVKGKYKEQVGLTYLTHGHYYDQLKRYIDLFGYSNLHIILTDDFKINSEEAVKNTLNFLGVDFINARIDVSQRSNESGVPKILWLQRVLLSYDTCYKVLLRKFTSQRFRYILRKHITKKIIEKNIRPFSYSSMHPETRNNLIEYFKPWNEKLATLINIDLSMWNK